MEITRENFKFCLVCVFVIFFFFFLGGGGGGGGLCLSFRFLFCADLFLSLKHIPLLQLEGWGINPALHEAFLRQVFSHIRGKRTVRHVQV